jgi:hypothetical protein
MNVMRAGLPDVWFQTKNNLGNFWRALPRLESVYTVYIHIAIWNILWRFWIFLTIWYIFPVLVSCTKKNLATLDESNGNHSH